MNIYERIRQGPVVDIRDRLLVTVKSYCKNEQLIALFEIQGFPHLLSNSLKIEDLDAKTFL